jgi:hypothetical protein
MRNQLLRIVPGVLVALVAPIVVYALVRSSVDSDVTAFAVGAAVPVAWTLGRFAVLRKVDPFGVFGVVAFGLALVVTWLTGGSPLALEMRDSVPTGLLGLAFLVSVLVGRPLNLVLLRLFGRWQPKLAQRARTTPAGSANVLSTLIGALLLVHAAVLIGLALSVSTATYLGISQPVSLTILGIGAAVVLWYRRAAVTTG